MKNGIDEKLDTAISLMDAALKKYGEGDFDIAEKRRASANGLFDEVKKAMATEDGKDDMVYGESRNFGKIFKVFESNTNRLFETREGQRAVAEIVSTIRRDKDLSTEFKIYESIENPKTNGNAAAYTEEVIRLMETFTPKGLKEKHSRLISLFRKHGLDESLELDSGTEKLYESIDYVIANRKGFNNISEIAEAKSMITKAISENDLKAKNCFEGAIDKIVESISDKYENVLNDDEKKLVSELTAPGADVKGVFESTKRECIAFLTESMAEEPEKYKSWMELIENVRGKEYSESGAIEDIAKMIEIQNV